MDDLKNLDNNFATKVCIGFMANASYRVKLQEQEDIILVNKSTLVNLLNKLVIFYKNYNEIIKLNSFVNINNKVIDHRNIELLHSNLINKIRILDTDFIHSSTLKTIIIENFKNSKLIESSTNSKIIIAKQLYEIIKTLNYIQSD